MHYSREGDKQVEEVEEDEDEELDMEGGMEKWGAGG